VSKNRLKQDWVSGIAGIRIIHKTKYLLIFTVDFMETYSSNKDNSIFQDLGPFKLLNADNSVKGKAIYSYSVKSKTTEIGHKLEIGNK